MVDHGLKVGDEVYFNGLNVYGDEPEHPHTGLMARVHSETGDHMVQLYVQMDCTAEALADRYEGITESDVVEVYGPDLIVGVMSFHELTKV